MPDYLLLLCIVLKFIFFIYILEFNEFQPILKFRHYTPKLKPNELTDHDIQIMNLPFKQKKRPSQYKVYDVLTLTIIGDLHCDIVLKRNLLLSLQYNCRSCAIYAGHETRDKKKKVVSVSHVFMKGGYTACHAIAPDSMTF